MRTNGSKTSTPAKEKKQPAKTKAKRSRQSLLQSAPAETQPAAIKTDRGGQGWIFGLSAFALFVAVLALIAATDFFRSRVTGQPAFSAATVVSAFDQRLPAVQTMLIAPPARAEVSAPAAADPEADARNDYMLALATGTSEAIDLFLARHPAGFHADLARVQRKRVAEFELPGIVKQLNSELKRVGCGPAGTAEWTNASQQALAAFNRHAQTKLDVKSPDPAALSAVKERTDRVCPLPQATKAEETTQKQKRGFFFWE